MNEYFGGPNERTALTFCLRSWLSCGLGWDPLESEPCPAEVCLGRAAVPSTNDLAWLGLVEDKVVAHLHLGCEALHDDVGLVRGEDAAGGQHVTILHGQIPI